MATNQEKEEQQTQKVYVIIQILLRTMAFIATLSATGIMARSKESIDLFGYQILAKYSYSPAFRFFVGANAVACSYSLLSLPFVLIAYSRTSDPLKYLLFLFDLIIMALVMAASSAAAAIAEVGKNGNMHTGWLAICDHFGKFCDKVRAALICSFVSFLLFFLLTAFSAARPRRLPLAS